MVSTSRTVHLAQHGYAEIGKFHGHDRVFHQILLYQFVLDTFGDFFPLHSGHVYLAKYRKIYLTVGIYGISGYSLIA